MVLAGVLHSLPKRFAIKIALLAAQSSALDAHLPVFFEVEIALRPIKLRPLGDAGPIRISRLREISEIGFD